MSVVCVCPQVEFSVNADTQRFLSKGGDGLVGSITSFSTEMTTLVNKTIEDTLVNVKQYEAARSAHTQSPSGWS